MAVQVLFFGQLTDITGTDQLVLEHVETTAQLEQELLTRFPALVAVPFTMALNHRLVTQEQSLPQESIVACMPPFSGG
jgi:molybdopterin synthase sulfur carrier subunit